MEFILKSRGVCFCIIIIILLLVIIMQLLLLEGDNRSTVTSSCSKMISSRKLLQYSSAIGGEVKRKGRRTGCSAEDIVINEGQVAPLPTGIPSYLVQITNTCATRGDDDDCNIANIRVHCGWFSSARLINPTLFRRVEYDDCLVNDGDVLEPGKTISFQYANTYIYPLSVSSVVCLSS